MTARTAREGPLNEVGPRDTTPEGDTELHQNAAAFDVTGDGRRGVGHDPACPAGSVVHQLRRRREVSYRLPPLSSGRRDPWGASHDR